MASSKVQVLYVVKQHNTQQNHKTELSFAILTTAIYVILSRFLNLVGSKNIEFRNKNIFAGFGYEIFLVALFIKHNFKWGYIETFFLGFNNAQHFH